METKTTATWHDALAQTEWVVMVTSDAQGPHLVATWGDYIRKLSDPGSDTLLAPVGGYRQTEKNLAQNKRMQVMIASRQVLGSQGRPGQGYLLECETQIQADGPLALRAKEQFPWSRGVLVIQVKSARPQL